MDASAKRKGVANVKPMREWDKDELRKRALEREDRERARVIRPKRVEDEDGELGHHRLEGEGEKPDSNRELPMVASRSEGIDFDQRVGTKVNVNLQGEASERGGFYCEVCQRTYLDSSSYLTHLNSRMHQTRIGKSMKVKKSKKEEVKARLQSHIQKKFQEQVGDGEDEKYDFREKIKALEAQEQEKKQRKKQAKEARKKEKETLLNQEQDQDANQEMMTMMGFASFATSKS